MIQVLNKWTGEVYELPDKTPADIKAGWLALDETIKACKRAKDKLKPKVVALLEPNGIYDFGDYRFRQSAVQRYNYDKAVMRVNLDADTLDLFLVPDKPQLDQYLKENIAIIGEVGTILRQTMVAVGEPYTTLRLEKIGNEMVGSKNAAPDL